MICWHWLIEMAKQTFNWLIQFGFDRLSWPVKIESLNCTACMIHVHYARQDPATFICNATWVLFYWSKIVEYCCIYSNNNIIAVAIINISLAGVWLLIEGSSYLRVAFINFRAIPPSAISIKIVTWKTGLWGLHFELLWCDRKISTHAAIEPSKGRLLPCFCLELTIVHRLRLWPHPLVFMHVCSYYLRVATISFTEIQVQLLLILRAATI